MLAGLQQLRKGSTSVRGLKDEDNVQVVMAFGDVFAAGVGMIILIVALHSLQGGLGILDEDFMA